MAVILSSSRFTTANLGFRRLTSLGLVSLLAACAPGDVKDGLAPDEPEATAVAVAPAKSSIFVGEAVLVRATARTSSGQPAPAQVDWTADGGTLVSLTDSTAQFSALSSGSYKIRGRGRKSPNPQDSTIIVVTDPISPIVSISVTPSTVSLASGATQAFTANATRQDGSTLVPGVTWSATGGTINASGIYTAGGAAGAFRVIAVQQGGTLADTAAVTLTATAPVLQAVILTPASASINTGATQQFSVSGQWSNGATTAPEVSYLATGGTISSGGLYTAGVTAGGFRVIAFQQGGTLADTAVVSVRASGPGPNGVLFSDDFESGLGQWEDVTRLHIGTAQAHSGTMSLELSYDVGGTDAGYIWRKGLVPDQAAPHDQYVRWWQRWSPGFDFYNGSGSDQKLIMLEALSPRDGWAQTANWKIYLHLVGQTASISSRTLYPERFIWDGTSQWSGQWQGFLPATPTAYVTDRWMCTEVQVKHNTPGQPDGELRVWIDGVLMTQSTGVKFRDDPISWNAIQVTGYYDGGSPKAQTSWVDDIVVSTQRIGC